MATHRSGYRMFATGIALTFATSLIHAQSLSVRVRESGTDQPVVGAVISLVRDSAIVAEGLSNAAGRASLHAPGAGTYRVRVKRIGYRPNTSAALRVGAGETSSLVFDLTSIPISLTSVTVDDKKACSQNDNGLRTVALWDEVRAALVANRVTLVERATPVDVRRFTREVDLDGHVEREADAGSFVTSGPPFRSIGDSALASRGFVSQSGTDAVFDAPDADLLLSATFVGSHCYFAASDTAHRVELGLAFVPMPGRRRPDVRGALWVDSATGQLRTLEYSYTNLPAELSAAEFGGRLAFWRLDSGGWIISDWRIRMPRFDVQAIDGRAAARGEVRRLVGYLEQGGRATPLLAPSDTRRVVVTGRVFDSTRMAPLAGAVVRFARQTDSAVTDAGGRYRLSAPPEGDTLVARHARFDAFPELMERGLAVAPGDTAISNLAIPSATTLGRSLCGGDSTAAGIIGVVSDRVGIAANGIRIEARRMPVNSASVTAVSGPAGLYILCDVPAADSVTVRARDSSGLTVEQRMIPRKGDFLWVDLRLTATKQQD